MKTQIPEQLKADLPQTTFGKVLAATPVIMTVVATLLAGLATREMTIAQYDRSLGAQLQSKAGDQWNFFQAKRLRSAMQGNTLDIMQGTAGFQPFDVAEIAKLDASLDSPAVAQALAAVQDAKLPDAGPPLEFDPNVKAALEAFANSVPDTDFSTAVGNANGPEIERSVRKAIDRARAFDAATKPINNTIDKVEALLAKPITTIHGDTGTLRDFTAARLRFASLRYDAEARLNQTIAGLYEVQVRKSNMSAERHHKRSQKFFFGMLAAQAGVIIGTFAMAARQRNLLWSIAAIAGLAAVAFAIYIYFTL